MAELEANPDAVIAQPGKLTTANLLLRSWFGHIKSTEVSFDAIIDAVLGR